MSQVNPGRALYSPEEAEFLSKMEKKWARYNREKVEAIRSQLGPVDSLLEIGCGSGQILKGLARDVPKLVGVDEKVERLENASKNCPVAKLICATAEELEYQDEFDVVLTSQMLHEVKQFGTIHQMSEILRAIWNAIKPGGRYFLLDHIDPGEGRVIIEVPNSIKQILLEFKSKFLLRSVWIKKLGKSLYEIERRDLQDFVTKTWSFNSPMEDMEMKETHASFSKEEVEGMVRKVGFSPTQFITFTGIENDLRDHQIELKEEVPWDRKFLLVSLKP